MDQASNNDRQPTAIEKHLACVEENKMLLMELVKELKNGPVSRLDLLANKINQNDYPKNFPVPAEPGKQEAIQKDPTPGQPTLVQIMNKLDKDTYDTIDILRNKIFREINEALDFIEKHI